MESGKDKTRSPWETGEVDCGHRLQWIDSDSRMDVVRRTNNPVKLRAMIDWPSTQKQVRLAAERSLRKLTGTGKRP